MTAEVTGAVSEAFESRANALYGTGRTMSSEGRNESLSG